MEFVEFVSSRCPRGLTYLDATNLCLVMYCVDRVVPPGVTPDIWTKEAIAAEFARLARRGVILEEGADPIVDEKGRALLISDADHWRVVIEGFLQGADSLNIQRALTLLV